MISTDTLILKTTREIMDMGHTKSYVKLNRHRLLTNKKGRNEINELFDFTMDFIERNSIYSEETIEALRELNDTRDKLAVIRVFWRGMRNSIIKTNI